LDPTSRKGRDEKCVYHGLRNFITADPANHAVEMIAVAEYAVRSRDPINHYVLSWSTGEKPTPGQVETSMDILLEELWMSGHLVIYGLHADTGNHHLHIILNRVNPDTSKCVEINKGFDIKALHGAVTRIEQAHGWKPEQNALFVVTGDGGVERRGGRPGQTPLPGAIKGGPGTPDR
jgi:hypothetical protein